MKFGKDFQNHLEETLPDWRDKFLAYKPLKKLIKHLPDQQERFVRVLEEELDKFNDFYVDKEEDFIIRLQELKDRIESVRVSKNENFTSEREFSEEMLEIRKAFVTIHGEMVLLQNYSSLNFAGLVKILKKYDKRTGALLRLPFIQRALQQPFFTTEPLTRLVRECEANLELLFPLEEEVIESDLQQKGNCDEATNTETTAGQEGTIEVYRSTLAAMKAVQVLRNPSSTYNPLSIAQFFHGYDDENGSGALTSENSPANSATTLEPKESDKRSGLLGD